MKPTEEQKKKYRELKIKNPREARAYGREVINELEKETNGEETMKETARTQNITEQLGNSLSEAEVNKLKGYTPEKKKKKSSVKRLVKMAIMGKRYKGPW